MPVKINIITCPQWEARKPRSDLQLVPASKRIIFHHTAGHHQEIENPRLQSRAESEKYARAIQTSHMSPSKTDPSKPWSDSGHNFLVCRNGLILQGRWLTVSAIESGHMVLSAHCPGQNDQIGIEHEHLGQEGMTKAQFEASATLMAWIADQYGMKRALPVFPHSKYFATACPTNLKLDIPEVKNRAQEILEAKGQFAKGV